MLKGGAVLRSFVSTLKLPRSDFPARPDVFLRPTLIQKCADDVYSWQSQHRPLDRPFVLHDGPPYANGSLHIGHALNKILKDIFNRFQCSQGKRVLYTPGWDCHGLPIELKALQLQGGQGHRLGNELGKDPVAVRRAAWQLATETIEEQKEGFRSWAIMGDWGNAYRTMSPEFEIKQLEVFAELVRKGLIFRQHKPVFWSPSTGTALAEAELEYDDRHVSTAAYVKFELVRLPAKLRHLAVKGKVYALIWTTTPWTLPANAAIAFRSDLEYQTIRIGNDYILVATSRVDEVCRINTVATEDIHLEGPTIKGHELSESLYMNPLRGELGSPQPLVHADFVSAESGSGLVHMAPGHGHDDYNVCRALNMEAFAPVDDFGRFNAAALPDDPSKLQGLEVLGEGSQAVLQIMDQQSLLWATHQYEHKYPIDWRTKLPVIIRATAQWFANADQIKYAAMRALQEVKFVPESGRSRLESFVSGRKDWCISRQRAWGVPIPALFRAEGPDHQPVMTSDSVKHIIKVIKERGIEAWWTDADDNAAWIAPGLPKGEYVRGKDTMDVWFDSGATWTQLPDAFSDRAPADVYIEGTDQHRGWFQSSLLTRTAYLSSPDVPTPQAPFRRLLTHGFTLDKHGRKMSKSIGNVISPEEIISGTLLPPLKLKKKQKHNARNNGSDPQYDALGPDALRLWVASTDYTSDVVISEPVLQAVTTSLHKYRVTLKWLLGILSNYAPISEEAHLSLSDQVAFLHLSKVTQAVHAAYADFEPHRAFRALDRYVVNELSAFYFEYAKDILYTAPLAERRRVQRVCYEILQHLLAMLAPAMPLLVAEAIHHASHSLREVLLENEHDPFRRVWRPFQLDLYLQSNTDLSIDDQASILSAIRSAVRELQERVRNQNKVGSGLECQVRLLYEVGDDVPDPLHAFLDRTASSEADTGPDHSDLAAALVVSESFFTSMPTFEADTLGHSGTNPAANILDAGDTEIYKPAKLLADAQGHSWAAGRRVEGRITVRGEVRPYKLMLLVAPMHGKTKCPRCWRFAVHPGTNVDEAQHEQVCPRCRTALAEEP